MTKNHDCESPLIELEANLNVLNQLVDDFEKIGASDKEAAVAWIVRRLNPSFDEIKTYLYEKWEQESAAKHPVKPAA